MNKKSEIIMIEIDHKNKTVEFFPAIDDWTSTKEVEVFKVSSIKELLAVIIPENYTVI